MLTNLFDFSVAQLPTDVSISDNEAAKSREAEREADLHGAQVGQMSTSTDNKQQHMQSPPGSFSTHISSWRSRQLSTTTGNMANMNPNIATLQIQAQRPSSTSEKQKATVSPSMTHVKKKKQSNKQQKSLFSIHYVFITVSFIYLDLFDEIQM